MFPLGGGTISVQLPRVTQLFLYLQTGANAAVQLQLLHPPQKCVKWALLLRTNIIPPPRGLRCCFPSTRAEYTLITPKKNRWPDPGTDCQRSCENTVNLRKVLENLFRREVFKHWAAAGSAAMPQCASAHLERHFQLIQLGRGNQPHAIFPLSSKPVARKTSPTLLLVKNITWQALKAVKSSEDRGEAFEVRQGKGNKVFSSGSAIDNLIKHLRSL